MQPSDIGRLVTVNDCALSSDGATVAYVVTRVDLEANRYRSAVWVAAADGSSPPRQLTSGRCRDTGPVWSPDGRRLAFVSDRGAEGATRYGLHVVPVADAGETATVVERDEPVTSPSWSPDGTQLAFASRVRDERYAAKDAERPPLRISRLFSRLDDVGWTSDRPLHIFVVAAEGFAPARQLTEGPADHACPAWCPDGRRLAVVAARHQDADLDIVNDVWVVDTSSDVSSADPEPTRVTSTAATYGSPAWSPDGDAIAVLRWAAGIGHRHAQVALLDVAGGPEQVVTRELDRNCAPFPGARPPVWHEGELLFSLEDAGAVHVYRRHGDGRLDRVVGGERWVTSYDACAGILAWTDTTQTRPGEVSVLRGGVETRLTRHQDAFLLACAPLPAERLPVTSQDGTALDAWVVRPAGHDPARGDPALVLVHGGPHTQYGHAYFDEFQLYATAGFAVVFANPHGSTGYAEAFARSIISPLSPEDPGTGWGGVDYRDLLAVADAAAALPWVDEERMGIMGGSYGGFMTSWVIGHTDRFAAAWSERAVNNLLSLEWSSDAGGFFRHDVGVSHLDHPEEFLRMSPAAYVKDITTPVTVVHSENDLRCHVEQADCLFVGLRLQCKEVEYHRFPAEGHELSRSGSPRHRVQRAELVLDWFGRKLGSGSGAATASGSGAAAGGGSVAPTGAEPPAPAGGARV